MNKRFIEQLLKLTQSDSLNDLKGLTFLLGVSGGADSMCMASLFLKNKLKFVIAHVNYNLRGQESDGDEQLVKDWAKSNGIEFISRSFDTENYAQENSISIQMAARDLRYDFFKETVKLKNINYIVIAHNLNDSIETLIINLVRGTGVKGLTGISERNGSVIRPMITFSRDQIDEYNSNNSIPFRVDHTNNENKYARNKIRNQIIPQLLEINPSFIKVAERSIGIFKDSYQMLDIEIEKRVLKLCIEPKDIVGTSPKPILIISVSKLLSIDNPELILYNALDKYGFNFSQIEEIQNTFTTIETKIFYSKDFLILKNLDLIKVYEKRLKPKESIYFTIPNVGTFTRVVYDRFEYIFSVLENSSSIDLTQTGIQYLDADLLDRKLELRCWREGDKFEPYGMKGVKKLSDFYTDLKIDRYCKQFQTLINKEGEIVTLSTLRISNKFKVTGQTKKVVKLEVKPLSLTKL